MPTSSAASGAAELIYEKLRSRRYNFAMLDLRPNLDAFAELTRELRRIREYVEPTDANGGTYSQRIFDLLMSTCGQFESACRTVLLHNGYEREPEAMNGGDYGTLAASHGLPGSIVMAHFWRPKAKGFRPFKEWSDPAQSLPWWIDYNILKHNRQNEYRRANLLTLVEAMAGVFLFLCRAGERPAPEWRGEQHDDHWHCQDGDNFATACLTTLSLDDTQPTPPPRLVAAFPIRCSNPKCAILFEPEGNPKIGEDVRCPRCDWPTFYDRRRGERRRDDEPGK
jgi:hypothetical protein